MLSRDYFYDSKTGIYKFIYNKNNVSVNYGENEIVKTIIKLGTEDLQRIYNLYLNLNLKKRLYV